MEGGFSSGVEGLLEFSDVGVSVGFGIIRGGGGGGCWIGIGR